MTEGSNTSGGWQVRKLNDPSGWQGGPYSWEELVTYAREGRVGPLDPVWHPSLPDWVPAQNVPGLFSTPVAPQPAAPAAPPALAPPAAPAYTMPAPVAPAPKRKKRGLLVAAIIAAVVLVGGGVAAWLLLGNGGGTLAGDGPDLGASAISLPSRDALVQTAEWGEVPANQVGIVLVEDGKRSDAEAVADSLGGKIVGELEYVDMYQIEYPGTTEADLVAALQTAENGAGVAFAFPNQQSYLDAEIWGVRVSPYNDPIYGGGAGDGYTAIGVGRAWDYIKGAGVELEDVHVGVTDDGLYRGGEGKENEFGGDVEINFPDPEAGELSARATRTDGTDNEAGSHGTGVSTIIAADPDNGGPAGVAGPLGKKLKLSVTNIFDGKYGDATTKTPDPNDPTKYVAVDGNTYAMGDLVALKKQIEAKATVINCSWGNANAHPGTALVYKKFFEKMAVDHPDVLFVCSGGNTGAPINGERRFPSGLALPNMITVGAVDNDGKLAEYSSKSSANYEITLAAPGTGAVVGMKEAGGAERQDGTSFSAPHVTAAAAILRSLNPKLTAADIKRILTETARTSIKTGDTTVNAPAETGGKVLAVDQAVLKVINDMRAEKNLPAFTPEDLEKLGVVDAVAITGDLGEYQVKGIVEAVGEKGATLKIEVYGENNAIGGKTEQALSSAGEIQWSVTLPDDKGTIVVTRLDSGAKSVITIEDIDINGHWSGTFTFTDITITDQQAAEDEGCTTEILQSLVGQPVPMTLDLTVGEDGQGTGTMFINFNSVMEEADSEPAAVTVSYTGTTLTITPAASMGPMTAQVSRSGDTLNMVGDMVMAADGLSIKAVFSLSKPVPTE